MNPKLKYILLAGCIGAALFALLGFIATWLISTVGVSHPHAPPAILVGIIAAIYAAPAGLLVGVVCGAIMKEKNYRRLLAYLVSAFAILATLLLVSLRPR